MIACLWSSKFIARFNQLRFLYFACLLEVQMFEKNFHFFKIALIHHYGANAAQKFIKIYIFFLSLVYDSKHTLKYIRRVFHTKHLDNLYQIEALDTRWAVVLLKHSVCLENIIRERFHIDFVQSNKAIGPQDVYIWSNDTICWWNICTQTTKISWCLLEISEMLS